MSGSPVAGKLLMLDAPTRSFRHSDEVADAIVLVDAMNEQAREFYERYGFYERSRVLGIFCEHGAESDLLEVDGL